MANRKKKPVKRPKRKLGLNNHERSLYAKLVPIAKKLTIENPPNRDNYGVMNKMQIVWTAAYPKPKSFPLGRVISDSDGRRVMEYKAASVLQWAFENRLTRDSPAAIYKTRSAALISLAKIERNLLNWDERMLEELLDKNSEVDYSECSEQNKQEN